MGHRAIFFTLSLFINVLHPVYASLTASLSNVPTIRLAEEQPLTYMISILSKITKNTTVLFMSIEDSVLEDGT
ncbi:MAG: hypothetical protein Q8R83_10485 [Legionellaceae bacterium]|nr:hypothetical protein [Legionellaceae bacterium]